VAGAVYRPEVETVPPVADHVTEVLLEPVTVAVNCCAAPVINDAEVGLIEIATGTATVTVADADFELSATLVAVTVYVPALPGAVYRPEIEIVPAVADQVTAVLLLPVTVAVNCCVALVMSAADVGLIDTATGAVTVTVADADLVVSATLFAVTV
jgi:hypothetical protein